MAWTWNSWDQYVKVVNPVLFDRPGAQWAVEHDSVFEIDSRLWDAFSELQEATQSLRQLGFSATSRIDTPRDPSILERAHTLVWEAVYAAEEMLLYHRKLAENQASYGFLHQHDILKAWNRYSENGRIFRELHQLVKDIDLLIEGYQELAQADNRFLVDQIDLPESLESDFRIARDLFSVGLEDVGLLIAGRGLEGVLREIACRRKILLEVRGKTRPAYEVDFYDLIETISHVRWKKSGAPVINLEAKNLLHYLRTIRNSGAHGKQPRKPMSNSRETAVIVTRSANEIWHQVTDTKAQLAPTTVPKSW